MFKYILFLSILALTSYGCNYLAPEADAGLVLPDASTDLDTDSTCEDADINGGTDADAGDTELLSIYTSVQDAIRIKAN